MDVDNMEEDPISKGIKQYQTATEGLIRSLAPLMETNGPLQAYLGVLEKNQEPIKRIIEQQIELSESLREPMSRMIEQYSRASEGLIETLVPMMEIAKPPVEVMKCLGPLMETNDVLQSQFESLEVARKSIKDYYEGEKAMGERVQEMLSQVAATNQEKYEDRKKIIALLECICTNLKEINAKVTKINAEVTKINAKVTKK